MQVKMTKLMEWVGALIGFLAFYLYLLKSISEESSFLPDEVKLHITLLPIHLVILFGVSIATRFIQYYEMKLSLEM